MDVSSGSTVEFPVEFKVAGAFIVPDSATYTLYDRSGVAVAAQTDQTITFTGSSVVVVIPGSYNTLTGDRKLEPRSVVVSYVKDSVTYEQTFRYRIIPFLNINITIHDIRAILGLGDDEVLKQDVDVYAAYLYVSGLITGDYTLDEILSGEDTAYKAIQANNAIKYRAALSLIPSLMLRVPIRKITDNVQTHRYEGAEWDKLKADLQNQFDEAMEQILGISEEDGQMDLFLLTTRTDPVTNT